MSQTDLQNSIILVIGVSGSGKSTVGEHLSQKLGMDFMEGDSFHSAAEIAKMKSGQGLTDKDRWPWLGRMHEAIEQYVAERKGVVVACSGLRKAYRDLLIGGVPNTRLVYLRGDKQVIAARMHQRKGHFMPPSLLDSQFETLEEPGPDEHALVINVENTVDDTLRDVVKALGAAE